MSPELEQAIIGLLDILRYGITVFLVLLGIAIVGKAFG